MRTADDEDLREEVRRLRNEVERLKQKRKQEHISQSASGDNTETGKGMDRRSFLKMAAGGAAGLGTFGMIGNASAFDITSDRPFTVRSATSDKNFEVDTQGIVTTNQIGTSSNKVDNLYSKSIDTEKINTEKLSSSQMTGPSLPKIRVYKDGGAVYAVDGDGVIDSGADAGAVIQSAIDKVNDDWETDRSLDENQTPEAVIDGGMTDFAPDTGIVVKDGVQLRNFAFDGSNVADEFVVVFGGPDDGNSHPAVYGKNIHVRLAATHGVDFRDLGFCEFKNITVTESTGTNIRILSTIGCTFTNIHALWAQGDTPGSSGFGVEFDAGGQDGGATGFNNNANAFHSLRAAANDSAGVIHWKWSNGNTFVSLDTEQNGSQGIYEADSTVDSNTYICPWLEGNIRRGMLLDGTRCNIIGWSASNNNDTTDESPGIVIRGDQTYINGPGRRNNYVQVNPAATDTRLIDIADEKVVDAGTRTRRGGVGENGSNDPAVGGEWNGHGQEGVIVKWNDGEGTDMLSVYRGGSWHSWTVS